MIKKYKKYKKNEAGFVILFSAIVSMIILLISSNMYNMSKKQTVLSSYARESQRAFYAANSALECAFYHDISDYLTEGSHFPITATAPYESIINCGGKDVQVKMLDVEYTGDERKYDHSFVFRYPNSGYAGYYDLSCAYVLFEKKILEKVAKEDQKQIEVRVTAVGYNRCKANQTSGTLYYDVPDFDDPTLLERRISSGYIKTYYE